MRLATIATVAALLGAASTVHAAAPLTPARAVAWLEANTDLRAPAGAPMPQVRIVSDPGAYVDVPARYGAYSSGVVYLAAWLPAAQRDAVLFHETVHWLRPAGCTGARELEAHTITARWMARTGRAGPRIPWAIVRADAAACNH